MMVRVVTAAGAAATPPVLHSRTTRFTRFTRFGRWCTRCVTVRALADLTMAGLEIGFSATCTAPPPTTAPPQVQAQSFARAILTDMIRTLFWCWHRPFGSAQIIVSQPWLFRTDAKDDGWRKFVNHELAVKRLVLRAWNVFRPISRHSLGRHKQDPGDAGSPP